LHAEDAKASLFFFKKKNIAKDHLLAAWKPSLPVKASLLVVMAQISQVCVMGKIHLFACVS